MKTFVMMTKMASADANLVQVGSRLQDRSRTSRSWMEEIRKKCPEVRFKAHYALLGHWDFMDIYEAPDEETAAKVSIITRTYGAHVIENWPAIPSERLQKIADELDLLDHSNSL
ncbi:MAG: GYD domain-containing protein [FCB group bacterium]|nr:GYD domain-containing protein [FCB group bacterium]